MTTNRNVLLVNADREMFLGLKERLHGRSESISVLLAGDGIEALQILKHQPISLVATELKMPRMDGFELLEAVKRGYPDIPVVIITGYSTPDMEQLAWQGGAAGFVVKPFPIERLADPIFALLQKEDEGGVLHHISSITFLQLVEMEQKTCTVRLEDKATGKRGVLFFVEGALCDARQGDLNGKTAAYEIFGWDPVSLWIQNDSGVRKNRIQKDIHLLILEAARRRDESQFQAASSMQPTRRSTEGHPSDPLDLLRNKLEKGLGVQGGVEKLFRDSHWDERVQRLSQHGRKLGLGSLVTGYIDPGGPHGYVMVEGESPAVIVVNRKCPRDKLMKILTG